MSAAPAQAAVEAPARRVRGAGVELAVAEYGKPDRATVLLIHGYPDTKRIWEPVAARLEDRFHVVAYDVRGAGASGAPSELSGYDLERLADDIVAVAAALAPGKPVHLVGHDWGSIQAWELVASPHAPRLIASFTSISGPSLDHVGHALRARLRRPTPRNLAALAGQALRSWYMLPLLVSPRLVWALLRPAVWRATRIRIEGVPVALAQPAPTLADDGARGAALYRRNVARRLLRPRADVTVDVPVQLIVAERDHFVSPRLHDDLERWVPALRRHEVNGRHWLPLTEPDLVARLIGQFVHATEADT